VTPCGAYIVDIFQADSAAAIASVRYVSCFDVCLLYLNALFSAFRWILLSFGTAMLLPMINAYGHLTTNVIISLLVIFGFLYDALFLNAIPLLTR
jgi:hypothetical protein